MPWEFDDLSKEVANGADDVKKRLEGLIETAEGVDKAFAKMTERQEAALNVTEKFEKATASSSKALSLFGHSGVSATRGLKAVDVVAKSAATSLGSLGVGSRDAAAGFKALSSEATIFSSDMSNAERNIAGLVSSIGGLESKLKGISASSVPINIVIGGLKEFDDFEQRVQELAKGVSIDLGKGGGTGAGKSFVGPMLPKTPPKIPPAKMTPNMSPMTVATIGTPSQVKQKSKKSGYMLAKEMIKSYSETLSRKMASSMYSAKGQLEKMQDEFDKTGAKKDQIVTISVKIAGQEKLQEYLDKMEYGPAKARLAWFKFQRQVKNDNGVMTKAIAELVKEAPEIGEAIDRSMEQAKVGAEEMTSELSRLENAMNKSAKSIGDLFAKTMAGGGVEFKKFADGLGASATGMLAAGVAGAYLANKIGDLAGKYADSAVSLAKYKTETSALEETILGMSKGGLDDMRKQLGLTREQAEKFFEVVKEGVNELGISTSEIMRVSKALTETFGGDQTGRLKKYVELLKEIPTVDTDLKITSSLDDKTAAIFALAESGKMDVVVDMQSAGLMGGKQDKKPGADMAKSAQDTAAAVEGIEDFLTNQLYPTFGPQIAAIAEGGAKLLTAVFSGIALFGVIKTLGGQQHIANLFNRDENTAKLEAAIWGAAKVQAAGSAVGGGRGRGRGRGGRGGAGRGAADTAEKTAEKGAAKGAAKAAEKKAAEKTAAAAAKEAAKKGAAKGAAKVATTALKTSMALGKLTKAVTGLGLLTVGLELGFGALADHCEKVGNKAGQAAAGIGKSAASIAGFALMGAELGSVIPGLGTAIGAVIGSVVGLAFEAKNLWNSFKMLGARLFSAPEKIVKPMSKAAIEYDMMMESENARMVKSGMALQQALAQLKAASESAKFKLLELDKTVANLQLGNLSKLGGSMAGFDTAINSSKEAAAKMYETMRKITTKQRAAVMANKDMGANERESALKKINEIELSATRDFASAMEDVIREIYNAPALIQAGLKKQTKGAMLDYGTGAGSLSKKDKEAKEKEVLGAAETEYGEAAKANEKAALAVQQMEEELAKKRVESEKGFSDEILNLQKQLGKDKVTEEVKTAEAQLAASKKLSSELAASEEVNTAKARKKMLLKKKAEVGKLMGPKVDKTLMGDHTKEMEDINREIGQQDAILNETTTAEARVLNQEKELVIAKEKQKAMSESLDELLKSQKGGKVDTSDAKKKFDEADKKQNDLKTQIDALNDKRAELFQIGTAKQLSEAKREQSIQDKVAAEDKKAADAENKRVKEEDKAPAENHSSIINKAKESSDAAAEIGKNVYELTDNLKKQIMAADKTLSDSDANQVVEAIQATDGSLDEIVDIVGKKWPGTIKKLQEGLEESKNISGQVAGLSVQQDVASKSASLYKAVVTAEDGKTTQMQVELESVRKMIEMSDGIIALREKAWQSMESEIKEQERQVTAQEQEVTLSGLLGSGAEARSKLDSMQIKLKNDELGHYDDYLKKTDEAIVIQKGIIKSAEEALHLKEREAKLSSMPEGKGKEAEKSSIDAGKTGLDLQKGNLSRLEEQRAKIKKAADDTASTIEKIGEPIEASLQKFEGDLSGVYLKNMDELSAALLESAEYAGDLGKAAKESFEIGKDAAMKRLEAEKKIISMEDAAERGKIGIQTELARNKALSGGSSNEEANAIAEKTRAELTATLDAKTRTLYAAKETKFKRNVVELARKSKELKEQELDVQQGLIDDAMSFASDFGGSFASIAALQQLNVGVAKQQLDAAKEARDEIQKAFDAAAQGSTEQSNAGLALFKANAEVAKKTLGLRRKEMGVQKDMMDRMLGSVFGGLRENFGARQQVGSQQSLMGVEATRMMSASGVYVDDVPGGRPGTMEERAAKRMTGGTSGALDDLAKGGGPMADIAKALNTTPSRKPEDKLAEALGATDENTERSAKATEMTADDGHTAGSIYTHDVTAEDQGDKSISYLAGILAALKEMTIQMLTPGGTGFTKNTTGHDAIIDSSNAAIKNPGDIRGSVDKLVDKAMSQEKQVKEQTKKMDSTATSAKNTDENTKGIGPDLTKDLVVAKKELKISLQSLALAKKEGKNIDKEQATAKKSLEKVMGLEKEVRTNEMMNPYAGAAPGIEDYDRVMAGKPPVEPKQTSDDKKNISQSISTVVQSPEDKAYAESLASSPGEADRKAREQVEIQAKAAKEKKNADQKAADAKQIADGKYWASTRTASGVMKPWESSYGKKATAGVGGSTMGGATLKGMSDIHSIKGLNKDMHNLKGMGDIHGIKGMGDISGMAGDNVKSMGGSSIVGAATPRKSTSGGITAIGGVSESGASGMGVTKTGRSTGTDTMATRAAGTAQVPPMSGNQVAAAGAAGAGAVGGGDTSQSSMTVSGEMMVKFDNKMFMDTLTPIVLQIIDRNPNKVQAAAFR